MPNSTKKVPADYVCVRCGTKARHFVTDCFALNLECRKCSKVGHIAKVCKSRKEPDNMNQVTRERHQVDEAEYNDDPTQYITINATRPVNDKFSSSSGKYDSSHFL